MSETAPAPRTEPLPDGTRRVHFGETLLLESFPTSHVDIRPFTLIEYLTIGDPVDYVVGEGLVRRVIDQSRLETWYRLLLVGAHPDILGARQKPALALAIADALLDPFLRTREKPKAAPAPSSQPASPSPMSDA
jgi:hypothetical protein